LGAADDELSWLSAVVGCGCTLARINIDDIEVVLTVGAIDEFDPHIGDRMPLYPPHGSVAVAWRSPEAIDEWLPTAPEPLADEAVDELHSTLAGIRERSYAIYSVDRHLQPAMNEIRHLLGQVGDHAPSEMLHNLLRTAAVGLRIYTTAELATRRRRSVSYIIAPVFGPDQQPRYLVSLRLMRDTVPADELDHYVESLLKTTAALTALSQGGPEAPPGDQ
jgi:DNA-binding IclR family transcriptional regulator